LAIGASVLGRGAAQAPPAGDKALTSVAQTGTGLARAAKAPIGLVILLGALTGFGPISIDMYLPALPAIARSLHGTAQGAQLTVSAFFIGVSLGQLFYGPLSDRQGRRWPLLVGVLIYFGATLGCMLATSMAMLISLRILQALGACAGMVVARAVVRDRFAHDEVIHIFSLLMLVMGLGPILAPLIGGWILLIVDWRWIFGVQAAFSLIMAAAVFFALPESLSSEGRRHARAEHPFTSYGALLVHPKLVGYLLTGAFSGAALFTYVSSSPDVIIGHFHISPQLFGWVFGVNAIGLVGATQINARLARRYPSDVILGRANLVVFAVSVVLLIDAMTGFGGFLGVVIPLFGIMTGMGFNQGNAAAGALNVDPRRAGATSALLGASSFAAGAGASALAGIFRDGTARPMALVIVLSLVVAVVSLRTLVLQRR
jgi:DHA1 family bicyclomycin/chloramphenicol resistance-like MFS transporter